MAEDKSKRDNDDSAIEKLKERVKQLYEFRDFYLHKHPIDDALRKNGDVEEELKKTLVEFDKLEEAAQKENRASFSFLKGRALNISQDHNPEAEQLLSKSLKLDSSLSLAWNELGLCYWKRNDILGAKNCFLKNPKDKVSLRSVAILTRQQPSQSRQERLQNVENGLARATEAVELDPSDGLSWLILGNSYLMSFFATGQNPRQIKQAMAAYLQAEKDAVARIDPDLHYNKAMALHYQEEYLKALEGFSQAHALDPAWESPVEKEQKLLRFLEAAQQLTSSQGKLRPKKLHNMLKTLNLKQLGPFEGGEFKTHDGRILNLKQVTLNELKPGMNPETVVLGKVVSGLHSEDSVAFSFCLTDKNENCVVVTIYNLAEGKGVIIGDSVAIPEPLYSQVQFQYKEKEFNFNSIRVETPIILVVNGRRLGREYHALPSVSMVVSNAAPSS